MRKDNPMYGFEVTMDDLHYVGHDLQRPECILENLIYLPYYLRKYFQV